ncbi:MAG: hypothetical protein IK099_06790 [Clostridia bacterium]|nr:hypothetical protein [Clostridia bacterium]
MPDFSPDEINLIFIYGNDGKEKLTKRLTKMLDDAEEDFSVLARGVIEKVSGMTDQAFREMNRDLVPDFDKDE